MEIRDANAAAEDATGVVHLGLLHQESPAAAEALRSWRTSEDDVFDQRPGSALARAVIRGMLAGLTASEPEDWKIDKAASGTPNAIHRDGRKAPAISFSHSGLWIACAASFVGSIGIDVELTKATRDHLGIAERAFGIREQAAARRSVDRFYCIWTLREAISKATGEGLRLAADSVDRVPDGPFEDSGWSRFDGNDWWLMHSKPSAGVNLAVALRAPRSPITIRWWPE